MPEPVDPEDHWRARPEAARVLVRTEKSWARPPELAAAKKTSKIGLASLKLAGLGFFGFFLKSNLYYYFIILSFF